MNKVYYKINKNDCGVCYIRVFMCFKLTHVAWGNLYTATYIRTCIWLCQSRGRQQRKLCDNQIVVKSEYNYMFGK